MNFNHEELMLMMLYNTGTRLGLIHELRLMQCYLMPDETALRELSEQPRIVSQHFDNLCTMTLAIRRSRAAALEAKLGNVEGADVKRKG